MPLQIDNANLKEFIVVGDRVLVKPTTPMEKTKGGLLLPPTVQENETLATGFVMKVGPGYPIPAIADDEPWKSKSDEVRYVPLQAQEGDLAIFLQRNAYEITYKGEKYNIVGHSSILMLIRYENFID